MQHHLTQQVNEYEIDIYNADTKFPSLETQTIEIKKCDRVTTFAKAKTEQTNEQTELLLLR